MPIAMRPRVLRAGGRLRSGVGLTIRSDSLTAVAIRRNKAQWSRVAERNVERSLDEQIAELIEAIPKALRRLRVRLYVAVGCAEAQVRCLPGIPDASSSDLRNIVAAGASRFFLGGTGAVTTGGVRRVESGVWAAAYSRDVIEALESVGIGASISKVTIVPLATTLPTPSHESTALFEDAGVESLATYDAHGCLVGLERRVVSISSEHCAIGAPSSLDHKCATESQNRAAALGAVLRGGAEPLRLTLDLRNSHRNSLLRLRCAAACCIIALVAAMAAPGLIARRRSGVFAAELHSRNREQLAALQAQLELARATRGLNELAAFDAKALPVSILIARITRALPEGAALVMLQLDTIGGSAVVVGPRAANVINAFEHIRGVSAPSIVGPIAPEQAPATGGAGVGNVAAERVTMHFQRTASW